MLADHTADSKGTRVVTAESMITNPSVIKGQDPCAGSDPISQTYFAAVLDLVGDVDWQEGEVGAVGLLGALLLALWCTCHIGELSLIHI